MRKNYTDKALNNLTCCHLTKSAFKITPQLERYLNVFFPGNDTNIAIVWMVTRHLVMFYAFKENYQGLI